MSRKALTSPTLIIAITILQFVPLILFPASSFAPSTQEWWLPVMLAVMVLIADFYLIVRRTTAGWPWTLFSFAQGFNIISRLMMVFSHATKGGSFNGPYVALSIASMLLSVFVLWYVELPEVRLGLLRA